MDVYKVTHLLRSLSFFVGQNYAWVDLTYIDSGFWSTFDFAKDLQRGWSNDSMKQIERAGAIKPHSVAGLDCQLRMELFERYDGRLGIHATPA